MKKFRSLFMVATLAMMSAGCSSDNDDLLGDNGSINDNDNVYMSVKVEVPTDKSGRGVTQPDGSSNDGTEAGQDFENKINDVTILIVGNKAKDAITTPADDDVILVASKKVETPIGANKVYTVPFNANKINSIMSTAEMKDVTIWVICNGDDTTLESITEGETTLTSLTQTLALAGDIDGISLKEDKGSFLMTNAEPCTKQLKAADFSRDPLKPYNLGTVLVERAVARFDYKVKEGTTLSFDLNAGAPYEGYTASVKLEKAAPINMSKKFYWFKRVSEDGLLADYQLAGQEDQYNYVVDTDAAEKSNLTNLQTNIFAKKYFFNQYNSTLDLKSLTYTTIPELNKNDTNENKDGDTEIKAGDYARLFYCTENTIPADNMGRNDNQQKGLTTGIVFRGKIGVDGTSVEDTYGVDVNNPAEETEIYVFNGKLYGTWAKVGKYLESHTDKSLKAAYEAAGGADYVYADDKAKAIAAKFTIFDREKINDGEYGYFTYYYYWNRHNDNDKVTEMGPMEFGVVRNNVYKLHVSKVGNFGHPVDNSCDPNPINPGNPDEDNNYYFEVNVEVQPWVVRINDIEF